MILIWVAIHLRFPVLFQDLDHAFESKDDVAKAVKDQLSHLMSEYGYEIIAALVVDVIPDAAVKAAMNEINGKKHI